MTLDLIVPAIAITLLAATCATLLAVRIFRAQPRNLLLALSATALWFHLTGILAARGFFQNFTTLPPHLLFALLTPAIVFAIYSIASKRLPQTLLQTSATWLIAFQLFRILVELILWRGYKLGVVPIQMTFDGRNLDILIGLTAPLAAWIYHRSRSTTFAILWNVAGLASLLNIVVVSVLSMPTPLRRFLNDPPNTLLTHFPFIYLPAVLVPAAYIAHLLSLRQLLQQRNILSTPVLR
jgi:hypothetical protein